VRGAMKLVDAGVIPSMLTSAASESFAAGHEGSDRSTFPRRPEAVWEPVTADVQRAPFQ